MLRLTNQGLALKLGASRNTDSKVKCCAGTAAATTSQLDRDTKTNFIKQTHKHETRMRHEVSAVFDPSTATLLNSCQQMAYRLL